MLHLDRIRMVLSLSLSLSLSFHGSVSRAGFFIGFEQRERAYAKARLIRRLVKKLLTGLFTTNYS